MTEINNTTEGIGTPLVEAMYALLEAANNCELLDDRIALGHMSRAGLELMDAIRWSIAPPQDDSEADDTSTSRLAYDLHREADAAYACIQLRAVDAERMYRRTYDPETAAVKRGWTGTQSPSLTWQPGECIACGRHGTVHKHSRTCTDCVATYNR